MKIVPKKLYPYIMQRLPVPLKRKLNNRQPNITNPWLNAKPGLEKGRLLLVVVNNSFDQELMKASTLLLLGYAQGWTEACGPAKLVSEENIIEEINNFNNPIIFSNIYSFSNWGRREIDELKKNDHFVTVTIHPKKYKEFISKHPLIGAGDPFFYGGYYKAYKKLLDSKPKFVFSLAGTQAIKWYEDWKNDGFVFDFIKLAADPNMYYPDSALEKYGNIKIAYVGGYWEEKAQAFEKYLRPFEDIFVPFGNVKWPYKNYGGSLDLKDERQLYSSAGLIPLVTSPAGWAMAEVTERYFKTPACKAFCIADENPGLVDVFDEGEILKAESAEHFHHLVDEYLSGKIDTDYWRDKTYQAVINKHLYKHRAIQIKTLIEK